MNVDIKEVKNWGKENAESVIGMVREVLRETSREPNTNREEWQ